MGMVGFYAGSFDPFTNGHLAIVKKASKCFEKVIIGIGRNIEKKERIDKVRMNKAKEMNCDILIRGLRNGTDYEYEENISAINEKMAGIDTCYFRAGDLGYISSSVVMDFYKSKKSIDGLVPKAVAELLYSL